MNDFIESMFYARELFSRLLAPVCEKYMLSHTELAIVMFLRSMPEYDTASDIVRGRHMTKSAVSMAVRALSERGFISEGASGGDRRSVHLRLTESAYEAADAGLSAENDFIAAVMAGFSDAEREELRELHRRMTENMRRAHVPEHR